MCALCSGSQYGEVADECGDAYFWYGKALLEVARQEGGVLGDAMPGGTLSEISGIRNRLVPYWKTRNVGKFDRCQHNTREKNLIKEICVLLASSLLLHQC